MKKPVNYFKKRRKAILLLLKRPPSSWRTETFHALRVAIKKLDALLRMINVCEKGFKRKKVFAPVKKIFSRAGNVRDLQMEEEALKKQGKNNLLNGYLKRLHILQQKEKKEFFAVLKKTGKEKLENKFDDILSHLNKLDKKKVNDFLLTSGTELQKLFTQKTLPATELHELRKGLKKFNYNLKSLGIEKLPEPLADTLPQLMGKWHDCQVIMEHLAAEISRPQTDAKQKTFLQRIKTRLSSERKQYLEKIKREIGKMKERITYPGML